MLREIWQGGRSALFGSPCYFKHIAARRENYQQLQFDMGVDLHTFQQHTDVHWLSIWPAISCIMEQWDAISQFIRDWERMMKEHLRASTTNGWQ